MGYSKLSHITAPLESVRTRSPDDKSSSLAAPAVEGGVGSPNLGAVEVEEEEAAISAQGESGAMAVDRLVAVGHPDGGCGVASEPDGKAVGVGAHL